MNINNTTHKNNLHVGIAEKGKLYSIEGNYKEALRHYREAIRLVKLNNDSEVFFQHYSQCVMETLEISGAHDEVITYCEKFIDFLAEKNQEELLVKKHLASVLEKLGVQYILKNENQIALPILKQAQSVLGKGKQPLTDELLNWVQRSYTITKKQVNDAQHKHHYFIVRKDKIRAEYAIELPAMMQPF